MTPIGDVWTFVVGGVSVEAVAQLLRDESINSATLLPATGIWQNEVEASVMIRIAGLNTVTAGGLARILRTAFKQDAVYVEAGGHAYLEEGKHDPIWGESTEYRDKWRAAQAT